MQLASPAELGLDSTRLARIPAWLAAEVEAGTIPGAVVAIGRHGRLAMLEAVGWRDRAAAAPMTTDAVFRIASMTKPITSLAVMMLAEEGRLQLADLVSRFIPAFAAQRVGTPRQAGRRRFLRLEPVQRQATLHDLLRHTAGLTYAEDEADPLLGEWARAGLRDAGIDGEEFARRIAALPLLHQPGTTWEYGYATDVLGRVVEVVSGESLHDFVTRRICRPLGMVDSGFFLPAARGRVAEPPPEALLSRRGPPWRDPLVCPGWFYGGEGMVATATDYARLCRMFLAMGEGPEGRLVARSTVALMRANHLPPGTRHGPDVVARFGALAPCPEMGMGFGLGFAVRQAPGLTSLPGSVGEYFWGGAFGTCFWLDPAEDLFAVLMLLAPEQRLRSRAMIRQLVYQAVL